MGEEELMDLVVTERMNWHFRHFRKEDPNKGKGALETPDALEKWEHLAARLQPELVTAMIDYLDEMVHLIAADDERYYRAGVEDGIRIDQIIKQIKEKQV